MTRARSRHGWRQSESGTQSEPRSRAPLHAAELYEVCEGSVGKADFLFVALVFL